MITRNKSKVTEQPQITTCSVAHPQETSPFALTRPRFTYKSRRSRLSFLDTFSRESSDDERLREIMDIDAWQPVETASSPVAKPVNATPLFSQTHEVVPPSAASHAAASEQSPESPTDAYSFLNRIPQIMTNKPRANSSLYRLSRESHDEREVEVARRAPALKDELMLDIVTHDRHEYQDAHHHSCSFDSESDDKHQLLKTQTMDQTRELGTPSSVSASASQSEESASQSEESASQSEESASQSEGSASQSEGSASQSQKSASQSQESASQSQESASQSDESATSSRNVFQWEVSSIYPAAPNTSVVSETTQRITTQVQQLLELFGTAIIQAIVGNTQPVETCVTSSPQASVEMESLVAPTAIRSIPLLQQTMDWYPNDVLPDFLPEMLPDVQTSQTRPSMPNISTSRMGLTRRGEYIPQDAEQDPLIEAVPSFAQMNTYDATIRKCPPPFVRESSIFIRQ